MKLNVTNVNSKHQSYKRDCWDKLCEELCMICSYNFRIFNSNWLGLSFTIKLCKIYGGSYLKSKDELRIGLKIFLFLRFLKIASPLWQVINDQPIRGWTVRLKAFNIHHDVVTCILPCSHPPLHHTSVLSPL